MEIDFKNKIIRRVKELEEIIINLNNNTCLVNSNGLECSFDIEVLKLCISKKNFLVIYKIESNYFALEIKIIN